MARLPPSMALPAASEAFPVTTKGLLDYSVSVSTPMSSREGTWCSQSRPSHPILYKTPPASSDAQYVKIDRFEISTNL